MRHHPQPHGFFFLAQEVENLEVLQLQSQTGSSQAGALLRGDKGLGVLEEVKGGKEKPGDF